MNSLSVILSLVLAFIIHEWDLKSHNIFGSFSTSLWRTNIYTQTHNKDNMFELLSLKIKLSVVTKSKINVPKIISRNILGAFSLSIWRKSIWIWKSNTENMICCLSLFRYDVQNSYRETQYRQYIRAFLYLVVT